MPLHRVVVGGEDEHARAGRAPTHVVDEAVAGDDLVDGKLEAMSARSRWPGVDGLPQAALGDGQAGGVGHDGLSKVTFVPSAKEVTM